MTMLTKTRKSTAAPPLSGADGAGGMMLDDVGAAGQRESGRSPRRLAVWIAATVALGVLVAVLLGWGAASETGGTGDPGLTGSVSAEPPVGSQEYLARLANQGYIPKQAVDQRQLLIERLVARGEVPAGSLESTEPEDSGRE
jgi:hypothetical protein